MKGFLTNIDAAAQENNDFRRVLYTAVHSQLVVMSLNPKEDIGSEIHDLDQFIYIVSGSGSAFIEGVEHKIMTGSGIVIPAGAKHNIVNASETEKLKLYTVYSPPEHKDQTIHVTKIFAQAHEEHFDGHTTES